LVDSWSKGIKTLVDSWSKGILTRYKK
jgi:hypothetical protein